MIWNLRNVLVTLVDLILAIISFFIGMRIIFRFFGANTTTPFVSWIYNVSDNLIFPFTGIFPNMSLAGGVFDTVAIIALLAYIVLAVIITTIISAIFNAADRHHIHHGHTY